MGSPFGEFPVGYMPSRVRRFGQAPFKPAPLLGWGEFEVAHVHPRAEVSRHVSHQRHDYIALLLVWRQDSNPALAAGS